MAEGGTEVGISSSFKGLEKSCFEASNRKYTPGK